MPLGRRTRGATDVVESELSDSGVELEQEREGLANATGGTEDGNLGELREVVSERLDMTASDGDGIRDGTMTN